MTIRYEIKNIILITLIVSIAYICSICTLFGSNHLAKLSMIRLPYDIKCIFKEKNCEQNDITIFTLVMSLIYFMIGYKIPDHYLTVITLAIGSQILLQYMGYGSSFII